MAPTSSKAADVAAMVEACTSAYGRIDVLDNNVGIAELGGVVELPEAAWDQVFAVNLKSAYLTMKHVIPLMERQGRRLDHQHLVDRLDPLHRRALRHLLRDQGRAQPPDQDHGGRICGEAHPGERDPARADEDADGREERRARAKLRRRRCRGDVARARPPGADGIRRRVPGTSPGRPCISPATRAATSPASNSWSTAASPSNTPEARLYRQPCFCIVKL